MSSSTISELRAVREEIETASATLVTLQSREVELVAKYAAEVASIETIRLHLGPTPAFKCFNGCFVCITPKGDLSWDRLEIKEWERFILEGYEDRFAFRSAHGKYLTVYPDGGYNCRYDGIPGEAQLFHIEIDAKGSVYIKSMLESYLSVNQCGFFMNDFPTISSITAGEREALQVFK